MYRMTGLVKRIALADFEVEQQHYSHNDPERERKSTRRPVFDVCCFSRSAATQQQQQRGIHAQVLNSLLADAANNYDCGSWTRAVITRADIVLDCKAVQFL
jgi:hypothetical protein